MEVRDFAGANEMSLWGSVISRPGTTAVSPGKRFSRGGVGVLRRSSPTSRIPIQLGAVTGGEREGEEGEVEAGGGGGRDLDSLVSTTT